MVNEFICIFRRYCRLSQEDVAKAARIPIGKYREYEYCISEPTAEESKRIAAVYGLSEKDFNLGVESFKKTFTMFEPKSADLTLFETQEDMEKVKLLVNCLTDEEAKLVLFYRTASEDYKSQIMSLAQKSTEIKTTDENE